MEGEYTLHFLNWLVPQNPQWICTGWIVDGKFCSNQQLSQRYADHLKNQRHHLDVHTEGIKITK